MEGEIHLLALTIKMESDYSFMDMSQFGHPEQLTSVAPSIIHHPQPMTVDNLK
jgi:hypothetical protein